MLLRVVVAGVLAAGILLAPGAVSASPPEEIGKKKNTCVVKYAADCAGVNAKWVLENHGNLSKSNFSKAKLHGADLRGAKLSKAKLKQTNLKYAQLHEAQHAGS